MIYDPLAPTQSRRFEVLGGGGAMVLVAMDNGETLCPTRNLSKDAIMKRAIKAEFYTKLRNVLMRDRIMKEIDEVKRDELNGEIKKILGKDEEYQRFLEWRTEGRTLKQEADRHWKAILHGFWEIKDLASVGVPEPPTGKYDEGAFDLWMHHLKNQPSFKSTRDTRSTERKKLDNMFKEAQAKRAKRKNPSILQMLGLR